MDGLSLKPESDVSLALLLLLSETVAGLEASLPVVVLSK